MRIALITGEHGTGFSSEERSNNNLRGSEQTDLKRVPDIHTYSVTAGFMSLMVLHVVGIIISLVILVMHSLQTPIKPMLLGRL